MNPYDVTKTKATSLTPGQRVRYGILWDYTETGWRTGFGEVTEVLKYMARIRLDPDDARYMGKPVCLLCEHCLEPSGAVA